MKTPTMLVMNALVAGAVVGAYHLLATPGAAPRARVDSSRLEARVEALEDRSSGTGGETGADRDGELRLTALERRLAALETVEQGPPRGSPAPTPEDAGPEDAGPEESPLGDGVPQGEGTDDAVQRFRELRDKVQQEDRVQKALAWVDKVLAPLSLDLADDKRRQIAETALEFEPRRREMWAEAKRRGTEMGDTVDWDSIKRETGEAIQRESTEVFAAILPRGDAERVAAALHPVPK